MNILEGNKIGIGLMCIAIGFASCKKEETETVYNIEPINIKKNDGNKDKLLNDIEYVSILYADIFSKSITNSEVNTISNVTLSTGDKRATYELLLQNFIQKSNVDIPTDGVMRADIPKFVHETYLKFHGRKPNEFEAFYLNNWIEKDATLSPQVIYYSFGTSDEYRFY